MFLITSAAYINSDLESEFGKIPSSFLPIQNKRLFEHQIKLIGKNEIYISIPDCYTVSEGDKYFFNKNNVKLVYIKKDITLGESVVDVLKKIGKIQDDLFILHGDTLFSSLPSETDIFSLSRTFDNYNWDRHNNKENLIYNGFFSFSDQKELIRCIENQNFDFISGIKKYSTLINVKSIEKSDWFDCGHANTYYRSKTFFTTQREFNELKINSYTVTKTSRDNKKIKAELNWIKQIPAELKKFAPNLISEGITNNKNFYEIEFYPYSNLSEIYVFGNNKVYVWEMILNRIKEFINESYKLSNHNIEFDSNKVNDILFSKTVKRIKEYSKITGINLNQDWIINGMKVPSINNIINDLKDKIEAPRKEDYKVIHGDLCFSNVLFSFRNQIIKLIDPRGIGSDGEITIYGDIRYDLSKLSHSVVGLYDYIIADRYSYEEINDYNIKFKIHENSSTKSIQDVFLKMELFGNPIKDYNILEIQILLFLSMIPLHSDKPERQKAFLANALLLFNKLQ